MIESQTLGKTQILCPHLLLLYPFDIIYYVEYYDFDIIIYDVYDSIVFHRYQLNSISYQFRLHCHDGKISSDSVSFRKRKNQRKLRITFPFQESLPAFTLLGYDLKDDI